jgi:hypothetical protein
MTHRNFLNKKILVNIFFEMWVPQFCRDLLSLFYLSLILGRGEKHILCQREFLGGGIIDEHFFQKLSKGGNFLLKRDFKAAHKISFEKKII